MNPTRKYTNALLYHESTKLPLTDSFLSKTSPEWSQLVNRYREEETYYSEKDKLLLTELHTGKEGYLIKGNVKLKVKLDLPKIEIYKGKKFVVYRPTDKLEDGLPIVKVLRFGSSDSNLVIKNDDPNRSKNFWARHKCDLKKDKNTPGWWACYAPELFGDILKLNGGKERW